MTARDRIPLARPSVGEAELAAQERALRSGWLVVGEENRRFETALAACCGRQHAVAVTSGTTALELALWVLEVEAGDEVLVPAFGFPAAVNAVLARGAHPVVVDVEGSTWNATAEAFDRVVGSRCRAVVSIDQLGLVANGAQLEQMARSREVALIDDAACGLGGMTAGGVRGGGYGDLATLSFHPRKLITTGEGGALLCDDARVAERLRALRNHGQVGRGVFAEVGTNARLSEMAAAIGGAQLERLEAFVAERGLLATGYRQRLAQLANSGRISWQVTPPGAVHAYQTFAILLPDDASRDTVVARLGEAEIEVAPATYAPHRLDSFSALDLGRGRALPNADALHDRGLALPLYVGMRSSELDRVADGLAEVLS